MARVIKLHKFILDVIHGIYSYLDEEKSRKQSVMKMVFGPSKEAPSKQSHEVSQQKKEPGWQNCILLGW